MPTQLISTTTAEMARGACVCSEIHRGSPLESIAQHRASTPISPARETYGRSLNTRMRVGAAPLARTRTDGTAATSAA